MKQSKRDKVGCSVFPFVHLLWGLQTRTTTCLCGRREDPPCWVRPKGALAKYLPACNKSLHKKHNKERKYGEILHLICPSGLPGSVVLGLPGCKGALGPLCARPCSDTLDIGKTLSHTHNMTAITISCQLSAKQPTAALQRKAIRASASAGASCVPLMLMDLFCFIPADDPPLLPLCPLNRFSDAQYAT